MRNYKPFLLFLIYTSVFCWSCFGLTGHWLWAEIMNEGQFDETFMPINYVLLCTISGIIGLVLTGFTAWHLSLAWRNQTTIECLEKTRYLSPLRKSMRKHQNGVHGQTYGRQLAEIHANAIPGATRDEEGEEMLVPNSMNRSPALQALRSNYTDMEQSRERQRYEDYLDEQDSEKLPNAFDLGWRTNLRNLFGEKAFYWFLPVCNSIGDGWQWEPSQKWLEAREDLKRQRGSQWDQQPRSGEGNDSRYPPSGMENGDLTTSDGAPFMTDNDSASSKLSLKTLRRRESFDEEDNSGDADAYDVSSDEEERETSQRRDAWYGSTESRNHGKEEIEWKKWD